jgi:hypothetical protein
MDDWHDTGREPPPAEETAWAEAGQGLSDGPLLPEAPSNREDVPRGMVWMMLGALFFCLLGGLLVASGASLISTGLVAGLLVVGGLAMLVPALGLARRAVTLTLVALSQWDARRGK